MTRISSRATLFYKRVFPLFWFGFLAAFVGVALASGLAVKTPTVLLPPVVMALIGFLVIKKLIWVLADEVYDCGSYLLVRNRGVEYTVEFSNIMNVSVTTTTNPPQITLRLVQAGATGDEVTFSPRAPLFTLNRFARNAIAEELMVRVDKARATRRA